MNTDQHDWGRERGTLQSFVGQNRLFTVPLHNFRTLGDD
jgi:hypothetical protein